MTACDVKRKYGSYPINMTCARDLLLSRDRIPGWSPVINKNDHSEVLGYRNGNTTILCLRANLWELSPVEGDCSYFESLEDALLAVGA